MIQRFKRLLLISLCLAGIISAGTALPARSATLTTSGTSTSTGTLKITIEDFSKPDWLHRLSTATVIDSDSTGMTIVIHIEAGWDCAHTAQEILAAFREELPATFALAILPEFPCTVYIDCTAESCRGWAITQVVSDVPGQTFVVSDEGVPVESSTWSRLKALNWGAPSIRQR